MLRAVLEKFRNAANDADVARRLFANCLKEEVNAISPVLRKLNKEETITYSDPLQASQIVQVGHATASADKGAIYSPLKSSDKGASSSASNEFPPSLANSPAYETNQHIVTEPTAPTIDEDIYMYVAITHTSFTASFVSMHFVSYMLIVHTSCCIYVYGWCVSCMTCVCHIGWMAAGFQRSL